MIFGHISMEEFETTIKKMERKNGILFSCKRSIFYEVGLRNYRKLSIVIDNFHLWITFDNLLSYRLFLITHLSCKIQSFSYHFISSVLFLVLKYLIILATSVPSEQIFSISEKMLSKRCPALLSRHLEDLVYLNKNIHLLTFNLK